MSDKDNRGFASMDPEKQRELASRGGKAAHAKGTARQWTPEQAREAGRLGGQATARLRGKGYRNGISGAGEITQPID